MANVYSRDLRERVIGAVANGQSASAAERGAHLLFLPPYSPGLNPIEKYFSKLKTLLRAAAERNLDDLWTRIETIIKNTSPQECSNYIRYAGYA